MGDTFSATIDGHAISLRLVGVYFDPDNLGRGMRFDWASYLQANPTAQPAYYQATSHSGADRQAYARRVEASASDFLSIQPK